MVDEASIFNFLKSGVDQVGAGKRLPHVTHPKVGKPSAFDDRAAAWTT